MQKQCGKDHLKEKRDVALKSFDAAFYRAINEEYPPYPEFDDKYKCLKAIISSEKDDHSAKCYCRKIWIILGLVWSYG